MKKNITTSIMLLFMGVSAMAQNNVQLSPNGGTVCNPQTVAVLISGGSFQPVSYLWSTGDTSPVIEISSSGTYTLTVTGYLGASKVLSTQTKSATYDVLPAPTVSALTQLWVCKGDTVRLQAVSGYDYVTWSNGSTGELFEQQMNLIGTPGSPALDTMTVSYVAGLNNSCSTESQSVLLRAIRLPHGVGRHYQGKMNISSSDSIPAGLVLEYLYPVTYEMDFIDNANPNNIIKYVTGPGSIKAPASILTPGATYTVETTPVINGQRFCTGIPSTIGIAANNNKLALGFTADEGVSTYRVYTVHGQLLATHQAEAFNFEWLQDVNPQMLIIHRSGVTSETIKMQLIK